ncbi:hypothetical protein IPU53_23230 [Bacillus sp. SD088]|nr:hypothetical protein [Bacillus sp. SD088]
MAGNTQIFVGCTPEPTKDGIAWKVEKDVSHYLPVLTGDQKFTTILDNYMDETHTVIPEMSWFLEFYPVAEKMERKLETSNTIIPILSSPIQSYLKRILWKYLSISRMT